jgi:Leucine-rich repeat (LRR) protein
VLDLHSNAVSSLAPLTTLTSLRILNVASNHVSHLCDLTPLSHLAEFNARRNALQSLAARGQDADHADGAAKAALPRCLQRLLLGNNALASAQALAGVADLTCLEALGVEGNPLSARGHSSVRHLRSACLTPVCLPPLCCSYAIAGNVIAN